MRKDVDIHRTNGTPVLKKLVYPTRNLTQSDIMLQGKLDKLNWSCFVPCCENKRLMSDKKVVFFPVPEGKSLISSLNKFNSIFLIGLQGQLWKSAVMEDERYLNTLPVDESQFCCEEHFNVSESSIEILTVH